MKDKKTSLAELKGLDQTITRLGQIAAVLEWDQETFLPSEAVENRAAQIALITGLRHEKIIDARWQGLFEELEYSAEDESSLVDTANDRALLRECFKRWRKKNRVPQALVEELARCGTLAHAAWVNARKTDDFSSFQPHLEKIIKLKKEYAQASAPGEDEYDALLDEYEPGAKSDEIEKLFDALAQGLSGILKKIRGSSAPKVDLSAYRYPIERQKEFSCMIHKFIGYDFKRGRLDLSAHPFTTNLGSDDIRITTRYHENMLLSGLFSNMHEAGHGLYEQGIANNLANSILGEGVSLGIHESQSRFWENMVGRSLAFWQQWFGTLRDLFPDSLKNISAKTFYNAANSVAPSLIRVEADELTYSFHIIIRFRLERALIRGDLHAGDLPDAWRRAYRDILDIPVPNDADGCLQDVHWSHGLVGYFPTYALGNLYAAQFTKAMEKDLDSLDSLIKDKRVGEILSWQRVNIHQYGKVYNPQELCMRISGETLKPEYFLDYIRIKYSDIYDFRGE